MGINVINEHYRKQNYCCTFGSKNCSLGQRGKASSSLKTNEQMNKKKIMREIIILRDKYFKSEKVTPRNKVVIIGGSLKPNIFEFY